MFTSMIITKHDIQARKYSRLQTELFCVLELTATQQ